MTPVVTRDQAGLRPPRSISHNVTPGGPSGGLTHHWNGPAVGSYPWPHSRCPSLWRADQAYHMDSDAVAPGGAVDIAYTGGVCIHGYIFQGRWWNVRSAANGTNDGNSLSYAFCYMAGEGEPLTDVAKVAFLDAYDMAVRDGGAGPNLWPHHHWFGTQCPGHDMDVWLAAGRPRPGGFQLEGPPSTVIRRAAALNAPVSAIIVTPSGRGYMEVGQDGGIFTFGDAAYHGSLPELRVHPNQPIIGAAITPSGGGYWLAGSDGGVYSFGDAPYKGSMGGQHLNGPVTDIASTPTGAGYWLVGEDGGIFAFGDAPFLGTAA